MAEEKKKKMEFVKSKFLTFEEVKELTNDYMQIKLHDMKAGCAFCAKILAPVEEKEIPDYDNVFQFDVEYKDKKLETPVKLKLQAGESAVKRLQTKFPEDSYVGKWCVFSKTSFEGKFPQFINPMEKEPQMGVDKDEAFAPKTKEEPKADFEIFDEFKTNYLATVKEKGKEPDVIHMIGAYIATYEEDQYKKLIELCEGALKKPEEPKK